MIFVKMLTGLVALTATVSAKPPCQNQTSKSSPQQFQPIRLPLWSAYWRKQRPGSGSGSPTQSWTGADPTRPTPPGRLGAAPRRPAGCSTVWTTRFQTSRTFGSLALAIALAGCGARAPAMFDTDSRNPDCARQCLATHSSCLQATAGTHPATARDVMASCESATRQCLSTCPAK